ncbi:MAG: HU family DNA-binding protein [Clostridia bacterium]|nr:HU family DNA-binding protein [Clostridia bacterium]
MNRAELVAKIAEKSELTKKDAEKALASFISSVTEALKDGDKVQLVGFGTFETRKREARTGRDPRTGNPIKIPASIAPAFKAGKALKDAVN